jgi:hypothetical protein
VVVGVASEDGVVESQGGHVAVHLLAQFVQRLARQGDQQNVASADVESDGCGARLVLDPRRV